MSVRAGLVGCGHFPPREQQAARDQQGADARGQPPHPAAALGCLGQPPAVAGSCRSRPDLCCGLVARRGKRRWWSAARRQRGGRTVSRRRSSLPDLPGFPPRHRDGGPVRLPRNEVRPVGGPAVCPEVSVIDPSLEPDALVLTGRADAEVPVRLSVDGSTWRPRVRSGSARLLICPAVTQVGQVSGDLFTDVHDRLPACP